MGWLTKLFGQCGKVRFKFTTADGAEHVAKCKIESFNNNNAEIERELKHILWVEYGIKATSLRIIGFIEQ